MRQYLVTACEMKRYDGNTTEKYQIPSLVLMERAALVTTEELQRARGTAPCRVLVVAGGGNNGGDGLAVGRLLMLQGYDVTFVLLAHESRCSAQTVKQTDILREYQARIFSTIQDGEYDIVIDAIFGIGLSRPAEGIYAEAVAWINRSGAYVCSVDIPSGIRADTGEITGCAVRADLTVTYGFLKIGQILYPGAEYAGKLVCRQMGIDAHSFLGAEPYWYTYTGRHTRVLPARQADGNKGTFGKALVIAGSGQTAGAAMMAVKSVLRVGAGMVKVVTPQQNREAVQQFVPEAMLLTYTGIEDFGQDAPFAQRLKEAAEWADCILTGPGIGMDRCAAKLLSFSILESRQPLVIDADGLNLLAQEHGLQETLSEQGAGGRSVILTPHPGEFARLYGCTVPQVKEHLTDYPQRLGDRLHCTVVCKDARTVVVRHGGRHGYLNTTGNDGMATAGSGDVLAGMVTGLMAQGMQDMEAAAAGVYLHGIAGDLAAERETKVSMTATDIIDCIKDVILLQQDGTEKEA